MADGHHEALAIAAPMGACGSCGSRPSHSRRHAGLRRQGASGATGRSHAAVGRARPGERRDHRLDPLSRHRPDIDRVEIGYTWYARAVSARTSTRRASCSCSATRSTRSGAKSWACERTTSTSVRSGRSKRWGPGRTACSGTTRRDATGPSAIQCSYSILATEWPDVRRHLESRLAQRRGPRVAAHQGHAWNQPGVGSSRSASWYCSVADFSPERLALSDAVLGGGVGALSTPPWRRVVCGDVRVGTGALVFFFMGVFARISRL